MARVANFAVIPLFAGYPGLSTAGYKVRGFSQWGPPPDPICLPSGRTWRVCVPRLSGQPSLPKTPFVGVPQTFWGWGILAPSSAPSASRGFARSGRVPGNLLAIYPPSPKASAGPVFAPTSQSGTRHASRLLALPQPATAVGCTCCAARKKGRNKA